RSALELVEGDGLPEEPADVEEAGEVVPVLVAGQPGLAPVGCVHLRVVPHQGPAGWGPAPLAGAQGGLFGSGGGGCVVVQLGAFLDGSGGPRSGGAAEPRGRDRDEKGDAGWLRGQTTRRRAQCSDGGSKHWPSASTGDRSAGPQCTPHPPPVRQESVTT